MAFKFRRLPITSTSDTTQNFEQLQGVISSLQTELVSTLPGKPTNGQVVYYQSTAMAENGVVWALRYREASSSTHKWEFVGGPPIFNGTAGEVVKKGGTTGGFVYYETMPKFTVPLAGVYLIKVAMLGLAEPGNLSTTLAVELEASTPEFSNPSAPAGTRIQYYGEASAEFKKATAIRVMVAMAAGQEFSIWDTMLTATPVRIG